MIARVFPRKTAATPIDEYAFIGDPPLFVPSDITEIHISVTFTYDNEEAERLAYAWNHIAPVHIGGPGTGMRGEQFVPGKYLRRGYVITSRGCPNRCWFCGVWKRDGPVRTLDITEGHNVLDDNLLACPASHIVSVFEMLLRQHNRVEFTGGLEAARLADWHVDWLLRIKPKQMFFAYDTDDDYDPLVAAGKLLLSSGIAKSSLRAYVLIGYPGDSIESAEMRLSKCLCSGFVPMAMLYRDKHGKTNRRWKSFQRSWARPAAIKGRLKNGLCHGDLWR